MPTNDAKDKAAKWVIDRAIREGAKRGGNSEKIHREAGEAIREQQRKESEKNR